MSDIRAAFAADYADARMKFRRAAEARGLPLARHAHPRAVGSDGAELTIDVALLGDDEAEALLVLSSGMHGIEGFCGSGCQVALLRDDAVLDAVERSGVAVLLYHAANPYGFAHLRRADEDNVDLNRNFRDFARPQAPNAAYAAVHPIAVPATWPPTAADAAALEAFSARYGIARLQEAVSSGQAEYPDGLFYAGRAPAWGNTILRQVLHDHGAHRRRLGWIDLHSGLGPWGHGERIHHGQNEPSCIARARAWYGADVTTYYDGTSASAALTGASFHAAQDACPKAEYTGITLEFGTRPLGDVFQALRAEQWLHNHPAAGESLRAAIKRQMRDAFYDDSDAWKCVVYGQARLAVLQALRGLAGSRT